GREQEGADALDVLTTPGEKRVVLFVTGASGSGKSSFAQAGLLPALEHRYKGRGKDPKHWVFRPARHPLAQLADALVQLGLVDQSDAADVEAVFEAPEAFNRFVDAHTPPRQVNLLVIDQFEELFTQSDPAQAERLFSLLTGASSFARLRSHIIATLRV